MQFFIIQENKQILTTSSLNMCDKNYQTETGYDILLALSWNTNLRKYPIEVEWKKEQKV